MLGTLTWEFLLLLECQSSWLHVHLLDYTVTLTAASAQETVHNSHTRSLDMDDRTYTMTGTNSRHLAELVPLYGSTQGNIMAH